MQSEYVLCKPNTTPLSNLSECLDREVLDRVLHFTHGDRGMPVSAYERFRALCEASGELCFHPILDGIALLLRQGFSIEEPLSPKTCDSIWIRTADLLLERGETGEALLARLADGETYPPIYKSAVAREALFLQLRPFAPDLSALTETQADTRKLWEEEIEKAFLACTERDRDGEKQIGLTVPSDFPFVRPDPYHVEQILRSDARKGKDHSLLLAQLIRQICLLSREKGTTLVLHLHGKADAFLALLDTLARGVALPRLLLTAKDPQTLAACIDAVAEDRRTGIGFGIRLADHPTVECLREAILSAAVRYPFGRLQWIADVEDPFAQARLQSAVEALLL